MSLSELCIRRPVMTTLLMLSFAVAGFLGYRQLSVAALPQVDFPTISVTAQLPGASPETMAASVASPLERQFSTIAGISSMTSASTSGTTTITLQFDLSREIDGAALDVQAALSVAQRRLPQEMTTPPSFRKVNPADQPILFISLRSPTLPLSAVNEHGDTIAQQLSQLPGVAQVSVFGAQKYAVRVQVDPDAAAARGLTMDNIRTAIQGANSNAPVGTLQGPAQNLTLTATGQMERAAEYRDLVVAWRNGAPVRLSDIARVVDSVENDRVASWFIDTRSVTLGIQRQPDANTITVVDAVRERLEKMASTIPPAVQVRVVNDRSISIRDSVHSMEKKMAIVISMVVLVIFLFLKSASATIIPAMALPVSLIGTFAGMHLLGYSINNLTLLALTLAVGFVVDDAIVMMENIYRRIEGGMKPFEAALVGSREIGFTIISMTLSLVAVFIPVLFMGGILGRVFREFAVTISLAILVSGFVSLTLTPMLCARWLKPEAHAHKSPPAYLRWFDAAFNWSLDAYRRTLDIALAWPKAMLVLTFATMVAAIMLYQAVPKGFFPTEDTGFVSGITEAAVDISFEAMNQRQMRIAEIIRKDPAVDYFVSNTGTTGFNPTSNVGRFFIALKPRDERDSVTDVMMRLRRSTSGLPGVNTFFVPVQTMNIGGRSSRSLYQYTLMSSDPDTLYDTAPRLMAEVAKLKEVRDVNSDLNITNPQLSVDIDRDKAAALGISLDQLRNALYMAYASRQVSTIYTPANDYQVILEATREFQSDPAAVGRLYLRASNGQAIPLETVATLRRSVGPLQINHQGQQPAVTISFNTAPGFALGDAVKAIGQLERDFGLPAQITTGFAGTAQVFQDSLKNQGLLLLAAVLAMYIILGILYESYIHPITILSGLPSAGIGAVLALMLVGMDLSVIALIGVVMLIGIVKKNAIMMVDFAQEARHHGASARDAIREACLLRYRPIMMTTFAALAGTVPIAIGFGAGSELRQPLGVAVVGGLLISQVLTLYITPVVYLWLERGATAFARWRGKAGSEPHADQPIVIAEAAEKRMAAE